MSSNPVPMEYLIGAATWEEYKNVEDSAAQMSAGMTSTSPAIPMRIASASAPNTMPSAPPSTRQNRVLARRTSEAARQILPSDELITSLLDHKNEKGMVDLTGGKVEKPFGKYTMYLRYWDYRRVARDSGIICQACDHAQARTPQARPRINRRLESRTWDDAMTSVNRHACPCLFITRDYSSVLFLRTHLSASQITVVPAQRFG